MVEIRRDGARYFVREGDGANKQQSVGRRVWNGKV